MPGWMYNGSIKINKKNVQHSTITHNFLRFDHPKKHRNKKSSLSRTKNKKKKKILRIFADMILIHALKM